MAGNKVSNKKRLHFLFVAAMFLLLVIIGKLADLMIFQAESLQDKAETQWTREVSVSPKRGNILDCNGEILAASTTVESVLLYPKDIEDPGEVANLLSPILEMEWQTVYDVASDTSKVEAWLKRQITDDQAQEIRSLELDGVGFSTDTKRIYPYGSFMSQVLGYTTVDGIGQEGTEKAYEKYLAGYTGTILSQVDAEGRTIEGSEQIYIDAEDGLDVQLTLDAVIQSFVESAAKEALEVNDAKSVCAIVMDPNNADILAMVNYPEADLNNLDRSDLTALAELSRNTAITDAFEPGSIFKVVTLSAALDSGAATLDTMYTCIGYKMVDGEKINCWRSPSNPHGTQTFTEAVENSCNPAFMEMALAMGTDRFYEYIYDFGLGSTTGVGFSTDGAGIVRAPKYVKNVDLARIGFGQSIAVTPLQMITAAAAAVNGGILYTPRIVSAIQDAEGNVVKEYATTQVRRVISEETSALVRGVLESVVANGSGKNAQIEGYRVGGKTGTAQMYENGVIVEGKNISSFIAFAPADDPQYILLFIVREPNVAVTYGSVVAAPYARQILEQCLKYGGIEPTETTSDLVEVPDLVGLSEEDAKQAAAAAGLSVTMNGAGAVAAQSPAGGAEVARGTSIDLYAEGVYITEEQIVVPDIRGMKLYEAYETLHALGLEIQVSGDTENGYVKNQDPAANTIASYGDTVTVTCK